MEENSIVQLSSSVNDEVPLDKKSPNPPFASSSGEKDQIKGEMYDRKESTKSRRSRRHSLPRVIAEDGTDITFDPSGGMWGDSGAADHETVSIDGDSTVKRVGMMWENINFSVEVGGGGLCGKKGSDMKLLLRDVGGYVEPGSMLAIMGASGAGKTTLLNLLAGRLTSTGNCQTEGRIYVNGKKRDYQQFKKYSAYVMQDDDMFAEMTVKETITFSAKLRLPASVSAEETKVRVDSLLAELGLAHVQDSYIGNAILRGVSGGERKRVNIGTELVTEPSLVFMDEPTTGLDSFNALNIVFTMNKLCQNNRTIVTTIHQPRSNIYGMFDNLLLLSKGRVVYFGGAEEAVDYFSKLNFVAPSHFNPADYFIDLLSIDSRTDETRDICLARLEYLSDHYHQKEASKSTKNMSTLLRKKDADEAAANVEGANGKKQHMNMNHHQNSWGAEFFILCGRTIKLMLRERQSNMARIFQTLFFSILLGLIWLNQGRDYFDDPYNPSESEARNLMGIFFFLVINVSFGAVFSVLFVYPLERSIVLRERASGSYRVTSYFLAKTIVEVPRNLIIVAINCLIVYWMVGLKAEVGAFFFFYLVLLLGVLVAESMTLCISTIFPDPQTASAFIPVLIVLSMLFGGFFIDGDSIPDYLIWLEYLSYIKYGFQAIAMNQFSEEGTTGYNALRASGLDDFSAWANVGLLFCFYIFWRVLCYFILRMNGPKYDRNL
ncbi:hypothetical protein SARC_07461 [Sphaeroforma arctica JP610]|uniref:ABC transporter domain-containing protein n=1 Tax=Sphaeroforma arctica JP610 TaxID=667725 RepID=A0A0L0FW53_9EUKA|nr:hypothetical protein SARC_07461 [Sphaeroforma arctica JP610]KNC80168.1 hypothetical protein SARC_07461 [Sphaeroforma arctica JP610]|eukprot:XP_014154070.1 hypothetical protein SARC_07461 [Sphaeroforma arctica JP610]